MSYLTHKVKLYVGVELLGALKIQLLNDRHEKGAIVDTFCQQLHIGAHTARILQMQLSRKNLSEWRFTSLIINYL